MHHNNWNTLSRMPTSLSVNNPYAYSENFYIPVHNMPNHMPHVDPQMGFTPYTSPIPVQLQEIYSYPQNLQTALEMIEEAVQGEGEDRVFYQHLISMAPSEQDKEIIRGIRDDEVKHAELFRQIYSQLTGRLLPYPEDVSVKPPASYCDGLKKAITGEQSAVERYRRILYAMENRIHVNMMTEIITDELRHGILYNYLYAKNNCRV